MSTMTANHQPQEARKATPWPVLRQDLRVEVAEPDHNGCPAIIIYDPLRASYFRLEWPASEAFLSLGAGSPERTIVDAFRRSGIRLDDEILTSATEFATRNQLVRTDSAGSWQQFSAMQAGQRHGILATIMHNYLFFRVPLLRPDAVLRRVTTTVRRWPLKMLLWVYLMALCGGLYLISHQTDAFFAVVAETVQLDALWVFAVSLFLLKVVHEAGHALTTAWHGCRVPTLGVAFMMGAPVLYTDTTDAWRLPDRGKRLGIVGAGVAAEMLVAGLALMLWPFLPQGLPQQLACAFATTSIATTFLVNINPLMRFDGYFALSDVLRMPNLQSRAFAYGRWQLREALFGLRETPPEILSTRRAAVILAYAYAAWFYRLVLFLGIAWLVYSFVVKLLGIALFLFEIIFFIIRPLAKEFTVWWQKRAVIVRRRKSAVTVAVLLGAVAALVVPWETRVYAPAILGVAAETPLHVPVAARLVSLDVRDGSVVKAGDVLAWFDAPQLDAQAQKIDSQLVSIATRLGRSSASDIERETLLTLESQMRQLQARRSALDVQRRDLVLRAEFDGMIMDLDPHLSPGIWQSPSMEIGRLVSPHLVRVRGVVGDVELSRVDIGAKGRFVPDDAMTSATDVQLNAISPVNERPLREPGLADIYGGPVAVSEDRNQLVPRSAQFGITLSARLPASAYQSQGLRLSDGAESIAAHLTSRPQQVRGVVVLEARPESYLHKILRKISQVIAREQGF